MRVLFALADSVIACNCPRTSLIIPTAAEFDLPDLHAFYFARVHHAHHGLDSAAPHFHHLPPLRLHHRQRRIFARQPRLHLSHRLLPLLPYLYHLGLDTRNLHIAILGHGLNLLLCNHLHLIQQPRRLLQPRHQRGHLGLCPLDLRGKLADVTIAFGERPLGRVQRKLAVFQRTQ